MFFLQSSLHAFTEKCFKFFDFKVGNSSRPFHTLNKTNRSNNATENPLIFKEFQRLSKGVLKKFLDVSKEFLGVLRIFVRFPMSFIGISRVS